MRFLIFVVVLAVAITFTLFMFKQELYNAFAWIGRRLTKPIEKEKDEDE